MEAYVNIDGLVNDFFPGWRILDISEKVDREGDPELTLKLLWHGEQEPDISEQLKFAFCSTLRNALYLVAVGSGEVEQSDEFPLTVHLLFLKWGSHKYAKSTSNE